MFKLPKTLRSHHRFIHSLCISALFIVFEPFLCNHCSLLRTSLSSTPRHQRYDFSTSITLPLHCIASLRIELLGTVYVFAFLCSSAPLFFSVPFSLFLGFLAWVAFSRVLSPFLSWHHLLKPLSFPLSPVIYPHHGAPKLKVWFSPQDPQVQL